ncbi:hypothetical protein TNCV_5045191 [Trichonephila clavipes]|uniref:Uncharacterized protein n=1 Tax=Trichonephila clavipes TaxID=2585209 RepID=A0A8X6WIX4_TRICX|nr:hypothetical protein TNCV_5045191 [Trichonephila clavipes]
MDFLSTILQKNLEGMYPLCMIFGYSGPGKALPQQNYGSTMYGSPDREDHSIHHTAGERSASTAEITVFFRYQSDTENCNKSIV